MKEQKREMKQKINRINKTQNFRLYFNKNKRKQKQNKKKVQQNSHDLINKKLNKI